MGSFLRRVPRAIWWLLLVVIGILVVAYTDVTDRLMAKLNGYAATALIVLIVVLVLKALGWWPKGKKH
ncbi:MAG TPA: hypothetical protein VLF67_02615 [Candidatus Saccharimonas sp.]|nr:hypothetical protein [Candidatus Saccharimonas sp.]